MVRIAIVGATGGVGKEALRQALDAGHDVRRPPLFVTSDYGKID